MSTPRTGTAEHLSEGYRMFLNKEHLSDALGFGAERARSRASLCDELKMSDRTLRRLVEELRGEGVLVGSSNDAAGYFLCETEAELEETARHLTSRALSALGTARAMRAAAVERFGEQAALRLFDIEELAS